MEAMEYFLSRFISNSLSIYLRGIILRTLFDIMVYSYCTMLKTMVDGILIVQTIGQNNITHLVLYFPNMVSSISSYPLRP